MAKPISGQGLPWTKAERTDGLAEFPVDQFLGFYQDGSKEILTKWKLTLWERIKLLFCGEVVLAVLESDLPVHKISVDYAHVNKMIKAWDGDGNHSLERVEKAKQLIAKASKEDRKKAIAKGSI